MLLRLTLKVLYSCVMRRQVFGLEHIPSTGPCLLVFNHLSNLDPHLLFCLLSRDDLTGLFASDYRSHPFFRFMVECPGGLWLRRGEGDRSALRAALARLEEGWMVGLAPEGRRSSTGALREGKRGAAFLAVWAGIPVLPVAITGTENVAAGIRHLRRAAVTVHFGEPFWLPQQGGGGTKQHLQVCTDEIMCRIAALLPADYRGAYEAHPHLQALISESAAGGGDPPAG